MDLRRRKIHKVDDINNGKAEKINRSRYPFKIILWTLAFVFIPLGIYYLPDVIDPYEYNYSQRPTMTGPLAPNEILSKAEIKAENDLFGPESFAFYNGEVYASSKKGIFKLKESKSIFVARIGKPPCDTLQDEITCGRPLGIEFDTNGLLFVADAYFGIYSINVTTNQVTKVIGSDRLEHYNAKFINSLQISKGGDIYFTSSSTHWDRNNFFYAILEAKPDGRVFKYSPQTKELNVLTGHLQFPNGLLLSPEEDYLLISETVKAAIRKFYLHGPKKGTTETLSSNLPMLPDNIKYNSVGNIMVTAAALRVREKTSFIDTLAPHPAVRRLLAKIIKVEWLLGLFPKYGLVIEIDHLNGNIIKSFHDPRGKIYALSEAMQIGNKLYLGSYMTPFYSILDLNDIDL